MFVIDHPNLVAQVSKVFLKFLVVRMWNQVIYKPKIQGFPVAQMVVHGASNTKIMGSIPRENKSWSNVKL